MSDPTLPGNEDALRYRKLFDMAADCLLILDMSGRIVEINQSGAEQRGYSRDEMIGRRISEFDPPEYAARVPERMKALFANGQARFESAHVCKDGRVMPVEINCRVIEFEGKPHVFSVIRDISEKKQTDELIWRQANYDTLTGLPNRRMLADRLDQEIKKAHRVQSKLALMFIDLDRFKEVNDTLGHHVGDDLLKEAGNRLLRSVRESDTVGRLGGDEFTVILPDIGNIADIERLAHTLIARLDEPYQLGDELVYASASIGIAIYPDDAAQSGPLLQYADQAMYASKQMGRNRFCFFTPALQEAAQTRLRLTGELRHALSDGQLSVHFQPIIELASGKIRKAEALLRWFHPVRGSISPADFIPLAEETGMIVEIGNWIFLECIRWEKSWDKLCPGGFQISVNTSPIQFRNEGDFDLWPSYLRNHGLDGRSIAVEITEGLLLNRDEATVKKLLHFRDAGMQVAIDDFGTGYSALSYLKKFDIDYLKIDKSFVQNLASDPADLTLCEAIVVMAHKLGLKVVAEGVETTQQRDLLMRIGCDYAQGYLFAKPMPAEELDALLKHGEPD